MAVDLARKRLFVAELGNGTLDALDLNTGSVLHRIAGLKEPQGVGYDPRTDVLAVASAGDGSVRLYRGDGLDPIATVPLGADADNIRLDPRTGRFVVGYGDGGLATIDPASGAVESRIKLPAHPEGFQISPALARAYVNVPDANEIAVVDLVAGKQIASWHVPNARAGFPMAIDPGGEVVVVVFRNPAQLIALDASTGRVIATLPTCRDADDVFFAPKRGHLYVSCGEGAIDVVQHDEKGYRPISRIKTSAGARTSLFVPELDVLFVAARASIPGSDASILVFRPGHD
jgi:DNA-binding beta-propeller fold protein YncE